MRERILGTLTIGQAPRPDVVPIIDAHVPPAVRRLHRGVLDGLGRADIDRRFGAAPGEAALVTRLLDGSVVTLSRRRMEDGVQQALAALEDVGCDAILLLCTGTFDSLDCRRAWLIEPDHVIPPLVAGLLVRRRLGVVVPIAGQIASESGKWRILARPPLFAVASPYSDTPEALVAAGADLKARGAEAIVLDCIGFTERHRAALAPLGLPVMLSNAVVARALGELLAA
ncbi:MAG TPA: AroM family protein [Stellaceae bacterium]|nr:AroM family protein [Stellaceae bacterium]